MSFNSKLGISIDSSSTYATLMKPKTLTRLLALGVLAAALILTVTIQRSPANADEWNVSVTFEALNTSLVAIAVLLFWVSARLPNGTNRDSD